MFTDEILIYLLIASHIYLIMIMDRFHELYLATRFAHAIRIQNIFQMTVNEENLLNVLGITCLLKISYAFQFFLCVVHTCLTQASSCLIKKVCIIGYAPKS